MREFKGKVAVITGAASGIGRGLAERFIQEGMRVVLADIEESALERTREELGAKGAAVVALRTDVAKRSDIEALAQKTLDAFGAAHVLVNNAGVGAGSSPWESTWNDWEWVIGVNLWGVINGVKVFTPIMLAENTECHIVNTASAAGLSAFVPVAPYQVTKHAIVALSENLSVSLAQRKALVKVSVLCPGFVKTRIFEAERNRPVALANDPAEIGPGADAIPDGAKKALETGMSPSVYADHVLRAIRDEAFYVLTHPEEMPHFQDRMDGIVSGRSPRNSYAVSWDAG